MKIITYLNSRVPIRTVDDNGNESIDYLEIDDIMDKIKRTCEYCYFFWFKKAEIITEVGCSKGHQTDCFHFYCADFENKINGRIKL